MLDGEAIGDVNFRGEEMKNWTTPIIHEVTPKDIATLIAYCDTFGNTNMSATARAGAFAIVEVMKSSS